MATINVSNPLYLLGHRVEDRVTGITGVVASVTFDLYGCVQAIVNRGVDKDGKRIEQEWFDVNRLKIIEQTRVMESPTFAWSASDAPAVHDKGPAERPALNKA